MGRITPHLWFDAETVEAAELYASAIPGSEVTGVTTILAGRRAYEGSEAHEGGER
jgi:predicted 3-demethylubiquinone-9 3-methyltransferase (glyoxalase superfamily)